MSPNKLLNAVVQKRRLGQTLACRTSENAYKKALKAGSNVLEVIGNQLVETSPDGSQKVLKELPKACEFKVGTQFRIGL